MATSAPQCAQRPSPWLIHGALILAQVMFGGGSVVGKLGVEKFNPLLFALIREAVAGPLLLILAWWRDGCLTPRKDWALVCIMGFCVYANQACFIIGDKLAGPIISSAWQCSQPIFTLLISLSLGWEPATAQKVIGILVSLWAVPFWYVMVNPWGVLEQLGMCFWPSTVSAPPCTSFLPSLH